MNRFDSEIVLVLGGIVVLLAVSSLITWFLKRRAGDNVNATVANLDARVKAWWAMCAVFAAAIAVGRIGSVVFFGLVSFLALREFVSLAPTRRGDHRALFWSFFVILPVQFWLVARDWYGLFSVFIPVYAFAFIPVRCALAGEVEHFLERTAEIQWGLMLCVYCLSHVPALLMLDIPGYHDEGAKLLMFMVVVAQMSDVLQYVCGKLFGRRKVAPKVSPNKTVEGLVGGVALATGIGTGLWWITPFAPWQAALFALLICVLGFSGGLVMSAIKRDRGVKDYGTALAGHGGIMDRIDSLCLTAPVFFHLIRYFFT